MSDEAIIAAMGSALGFVPAEVIAHKIDREHGQVVVVLKRGAKLFWNSPLVSDPIESIAPAKPIESAPESTTEAAAPTIDVGEAPPAILIAHRSRKPRKAA